MKHENYEILNLIGYGLAKFGNKFTAQFKYRTKTAFYEFLVENKIAETVGVVKNRQDLFDPFFDNSRKGWWQAGNKYLPRKVLIDSLFEKLDVIEYAEVIKSYLVEHFHLTIAKTQLLSPIVKSKFKQLQITGQEAELYFKYNYQTVPIFDGGKLEDARLFGDGYDFQIEINKTYYLAEVKGLRTATGNVRFTANEYLKSLEHKELYILAVISNLDNAPKISIVQNPGKNIKWEKKNIVSQTTNYHSERLKW